MIKRYSFLLYLIAIISYQTEAKQAMHKNGVSDLLQYKEYKQVCISMIRIPSFNNWKLKLITYSFDGYCICAKLFKHDYLRKLVRMPINSVKAIVSHIFFFRSFFVDLLKTFFFQKDFYPIYTNKNGKHKIFRSSFLNIDFGYSIRRQENRNTLFVYLKKECLKDDQNYMINGREECGICGDKFDMKEDIYDDKNNDDISSKENIEKNNGNKIVCHADLKDITRYVHFYHKGCLETWITNNPICPLCKATVPKEIKKNDTRNVYLRYYGDFFYISLNSIQFTYEYTINKYRPVNIFFRCSLCPLSLKLDTGLMFFKNFTIRDLKNKDKVIEQNKNTWKDIINIPETVFFDMYTKINIGIVIIIQKVGVEFELSFIRYHKRKYLEIGNKIGEVIKSITGGGGSFFKIWKSDGNANNLVGLKMIFFFK